MAAGSPGEALKRWERFNVVFSRCEHQRIAGHFMEKSVEQEKWFGEFRLKLWVETYGGFGQLQGDGECLF